MRSFVFDTVIDNTTDVRFLGYSVLKSAGDVFDRSLGGHNEKSLLHSGMSTCFTVGGK